MTNLTGPFEGDWTYRSYSNNPDPKVDPNTLLFGFGVLSIKEPSFGTLAGTIGGDGWQLQLKGGFGYGNPMSARFQGTGVVDGEHSQPYRQSAFRSLSRPQSPAHKPLR
jgi:hypothetical protein